MTDRTKAALAAHFHKVPHDSLEEMAAAGAEKHHTSKRWSETEEHLLVKSVDAHINPTTGRIAWGEVHVALEKKGFARSELAIKEHLRVINSRAAAENAA
jgi:hypothetical protein